MIYLAADHRGFELKETLKRYLAQEGYEIQDVGALTYEKTDDYIDFVRLAVQKIIEDPAEHKGIFVCGSGHGMDMAANKFKGIRAALCFNKDVAIQSREHEDANVLVLASDWISSDLAGGIVDIWLNTVYTEEERNVRRLGKMKEMENDNFK